MSAEISSISRYVSGLDIPTAPFSAALDASAINTDALPDRIVAGSNLIAFDEPLGNKLRSSVALSLLLAQLAVDKSPLVANPTQWYNTYESVLNNLGWRTSAFGVHQEEFSSTNAAVHEAIIPLITAAFGPAAAAGTLLISALEQLNEIDKSAPWITLFERESKRLNVSDYQFTAVVDNGTNIEVHLVGAVLSASYGRTQVLFFKLTNSTTSLDMARGVLSASANLLEAMEEDLSIKLQRHTSSFIQQVEI